MLGDGCSRSWSFRRHRRGDDAAIAWEGVEGLFMDALQRIFLFSSSSLAPSRQVLLFEFMFFRIGHLGLLRLLWSQSECFSIC
jgi:hypothetical protein